MNSNFLSDAQLAELLKPFDIEYIRNRDSDEQLVVAHDYVRGRLSEIFGPLGWSEQTLELTQVYTGDGSREDTTYAAYRARVRVTIHPHGTPAAFWDGAGAYGQGRSVLKRETAKIWDLHSDVMNGALSVAFLRATKNLGNQFGLCLYRGERESGYIVQEFIPYPPPGEVPDGLDAEQQQLDMGYTPDPEAEHAAS